MWPFTYFCSECGIEMVWKDMRKYEIKGCGSPVHVKICVKCHKKKYPEEYDG